MKEQGTIKKEFKSRDVNRMRNLLTGKSMERTTVQGGYEKRNQVYKEGDIWEENSKQWTIKNGIKQTVTKFDKIKKLVHIPLTCPSCHKAMKLTDLNKKMYNIHQTCFNCVIERETRLKAEGKFEEYQSNILNGNKDALLEDLERALDEWMSQTESFVSEDGVVEDWSAGKRDTSNYGEFKEAIKKAKEQKI